MGVLRLKLGAPIRAIGANFAWLVADKVMRLVIGLLVSAWVARYLGPERFGVLAYALTFIAIFQAFALLGLDNLVVRDLAADPLLAHEYLGTTIALRCVSAIVSYVMVIAIAALVNKEDSNVFFIVAIVGLIIFFQVSDVIDLWFQSQLQSRRTVLAKWVSCILTAVIKVCLILGGAGLIAFAIAAVVEAVLSMFALFIAYRLLRTSSRWRWSTPVALKLLKQAWPLLISGLSILLYMRISVIFLRESAGNSAVGIYTVGVTLSELWYFIPMSLAASLAPYISRKRVEGGDVYKILICKAFSIMWILSFAVVTFNALTAEYWVALLYGEQYKISAEIYALHGFTFVPVCLGVMQSIWLINEGRSKLALYQAISGAVVALSLNYILTPTYGAYGAAVATVITQFVQAFLVNVFFAPDLFRMQVRSLGFISTIKS